MPGECEPLPQGSTEKRSRGRDHGGCDHGGGDHKGCGHGGCEHGFSVVPGVVAAERAVPEVLARDGVVQQPRAVRVDVQ